MIDMDGVYIYKDHSSVVKLNSGLDRLECASSKI